MLLHLFRLRVFADTSPAAVQTFARRQKNTSGDKKRSGEVEEEALRKMENLGADRPVLATIDLA